MTRTRVRAGALSLVLLAAIPFIVQAQVPDTAGAPAADSLAATLARMDSTLARIAQRQDSLIRAGGATDTISSQAVATAETVRALGLRSLVAFVLLVLAFALIRTLSWMLDMLAARTTTRRLLFKRLIPIVRVLIWAVAIAIILRGVFGLDARTLVTAGAAVGVAIGFAAQDMLKNVFGGLVIIGDRPFQVGDKISVGGTYGEVTAIGLRSTRIVTPDDNLVSVPNAQIVADQVANANAGALDCQVVTDLFLPGWADVETAKEIARQAAITSRYVYLGKPVVVLVRDEIHETFVLHLKVKAYVQDIRSEFLFMSDVTERARTGFREAGLLAPWHGAIPHVALRPPAQGTSERSAP